MTPYTQQMWHWFGRGQTVLLALNEMVSPGAPTEQMTVARGMSVQWMKVDW